MTMGFSINGKRGFSRLLLLALTSLAMMLSACTLLPGSPPSDTFILPASRLDDTSKAARLDAILRVATPQASEALKSRRILVMPTPNRLQVYQGARWSDDTPSMLRDRLISAFRQSGSLAGVVGDNSPVESDSLLISQLSIFHSEYREGKPWTVIRLDAQLIDGASHRLLADRHFSVSIESQGKELKAVVEAFGQAVDELSRQLIDWSLANIQDHQAS